MKKKFFKILSVLSAMIIAFSSISIVASAAEPKYIFDFPISQPQVSNGIMYLEIIYKDYSSSAVEGAVYIFDTELVDDYSVFYAGGSSSSITIYCHSSFDYYSYYYYTSSSESGSAWNNSSPLELIFKEILGFHVYGAECTYPVTSMVDFTFNYGSDALALDKLNSILEALKLLNSDNKYFDIPQVGISSLDYGFLNYSVPVLENLNYSVIGGSSVYGSYLQPNEGYKAPFPFYSYSCASALKLNSGKFAKSTSYICSFSFNFDKPVAQASFKVYLRDAIFGEYFVKSYGSDDIIKWHRNDSEGYIYFTIYNITHPVKFYFYFTTNSSFEYGGDVIPFCMSLSDMYYLDTSSGSSSEYSFDDLFSLILQNNGELDDRLISILDLLIQIKMSIDDSAPNYSSIISAIDTLANSIIYSNTLDTTNILNKLTEISTIHLENNNTNFNNLLLQLINLRDSLTSNIDKNTDRILSKIDSILQYLPSEDSNSGFASDLEDFTDYMEDIEDSYKVDSESIDSNVETVATFTNTDHMQNVSIEFSDMFTRFATDNPVYISFLITALTLGLAAWVIGRRSS